MMILGIRSSFRDLAVNVVGKASAKKAGASEERASGEGGKHLPGREERNVRDGSNVRARGHPPTLRR